jgi:hypothetical protein
VGLKDILFKPQNPNANIHGVVGVEGETTCKTCDQNMCTGCCTALHITDRQNSVVLKEMGSNCDAQSPNEGCKHVLKEVPKLRFWRCEPYHCSEDIQKLPERNSELRLRFSNAASLNSGEIDQKTHDKNLNRLFN